MKIVKISDIAKVITKGITPSNIGEKFEEKGVMYFRSELIGKSKYIDKSKGLLYISEKTHNRLKKSQLEENDILFSMAGSYLGKVSIVSKNDIPANTNQAVAIIRLKEELCNIEYIYYYMKQKYFTNYIMALNAQAAQPNINLTQIGNLKIPLPSKKTQNKIANILSRYDELIENNNKRIKLLEQMAEEIYKEWFIRFRFPGYKQYEFENRIPKGWNIKRLEDFGKIETGKTPSTENKENYGTDIMFIKTPDMQGNLFTIDSTEKLSQIGHSKQPNKLIPKNSIIVSCIGTAGIVTINAEEAHTNQQINSIILNNEIYLEWLFFTCRSLKETIEMYGATGVTMTNLNKWKFSNLKVIKPEEDLIKKYHKITNPIFEEVKILLYKNKNLKKQHELLLSRLITGEIEK